MCLLGQLPAVKISAFSRVLFFNLLYVIFKWYFPKSLHSQFVCVYIDFSDGFGICWCCKSVYQHKIDIYGTSVMEVHTQKIGTKVIVKATFASSYSAMWCPTVCVQPHQPARQQRGHTSGTFLLLWPEANMIRFAETSWNNTLVYFYTKHVCILPYFPLDDPTGHVRAIPRAARKAFVVPSAACC